MREVTWALWDLRSKQQRMYIPLPRPSENNVLFMAHVDCHLRCPLEVLVAVQAAVDVEAACCAQLEGATSAAPKSRSCRTREVAPRKHFRRTTSCPKASNLVRAWKPRTAYRTGRRRSRRRGRVAAASASARGVRQRETAAAVEPAEGR